VDSSKQDRPSNTSEASKEAIQPELSLQENVPSASEVAPPPPPKPASPANSPDKAAQKSKEEKSNPFKGIGAAFNNTMKQASTATVGGNQTRLNPFARFGREPTSESARSGGFGGFNQLRQATLSRMRSGGIDVNEEVSGESTPPASGASPIAQVKKV
jgi:hypothetical protein